MLAKALALASFSAAMRLARSSGLRLSRAAFAAAALAVAALAAAALVLVALVAAVLVDAALALVALVVLLLVVLMATLVIHRERCHVREKPLALHVIQIERLDYARKFFHLRLMLNMLLLFVYVVHLVSSELSASAACVRK